MKAVIVDAGGEARKLVLGDVPEPTVAPGDIVVAVRAFSLNHGEVAGALMQSASGARPGWDYSGVVETAPTDSGFSPGDRVVGLVASGAWAERIAVPPRQVVSLQERVTFAAASALPVAGLTAEISLSKASSLRDKRVLVTAATGGVGLFAIQLAAAAGAHVTAFVREGSSADLLKSLGAADVAVGVEAASAMPPFDVILEGVGGDLLGHALGWLSFRGLCVLFGDAGAQPTTTFNAERFRMGPGGGTTLYGFFLGEELARAPASPPLTKLATMLAEGTLDPVVRAQADWSEIHTVATDLLARKHMGKAVLTIQ